MTDANPTGVQTGPGASESDGPTLRQLFSLWLPLAASTILMVLEPSIINIGLGRTLDPELALAAYGVAFSLALVVEAPILMLLDASVARSVDQEAFRLLRRFALLLGLLVTAIGLLVSLTPLYTLIVEQLMNIPADVAARARPTLQILSFWPLPIGWRRTHQGVLIRANRTGMITVATGVRLLTLAAGLFGGLVLLPGRGAVIAGVAMDVSVTVEAALITWATGPVLRTGTFGGEPLREPAPRTMRELWRFYQPLAVSTILRQITRPILNAGVAAAGMARASLAAWPVVWGFTILIAGPAWSLQQLTTALAVDEVAYRRVRRFSMSLSGVFAVLLVLAGFTPLYDLVMGGVYNLSPDLQELARPALQLMVVYPLLMGAQSLLRGVLIRTGNTGVVSSAMMANVLVLAATVLVLVWLFSVSGVMVAAIAVMVGAVAEQAWLVWRREG
jgi:O-antigen/teichoic acid export membrane protein